MSLWRLSDYSTDPVPALDVFLGLGDVLAPVKPSVEGGAEKARVLDVLDRSYLRGFRFSWRFLRQMWMIDDFVDANSKPKNCVQVRLRSQLPGFSFGHTQRFCRVR